ncbi:MAG: ABC transporter substrate-binding protein [Crenarchaeota archaeon]|nr:ABC transporter substrate-binding protein [Thermoproteota archaeon]
MRKSFYLPIALLLIALVVVSNISYSYPVTVKDALNRVVVIKTMPKRVISLSPSITEIMASLGLLNKLVGVDSISYKDPYYGISEYCKTHNVTDVGGYWWSAIKTEKIIALKPDLVLADAGAHYKLLKFFEDYNITVVYLHAGAAKSIEDIYTDIATVAQIFNVSSTKVSKVIQDIENNITVARQFLAPYKSIRAVVVVGFYEGIWVAGKATFIDDLLSKIGVTNVATTVGWKAVNIETLASWKPQIIILDTSYYNNKTLTEYGLTKLNAKLVFLNKTDIDLLSRPGPLIGKAALMLAQRIANVLGPAPTVTPITKTVVKTNTVSYTVTKTSTTTMTKEFASATTIVKTHTETVERTPYGLIAGVSIAVILIGIAIGYLISKRH